MSFLMHGTAPINWVYQIRQHAAVYINHHGDKLDAKEVAFLEDELFPVMDSYIKLCEQIDEERELQEQAQLDHQYDQLLTVAN